ncbi:amino acid adenylation domain-containing protein [Streptomyces fragilis]|uniref:Amino acid adenylation domain-containing protein n=1 Tax=Streptomyces fragilis TaxID=67301 RepID=A0ABV2YNH4_9ACTN|nr:amino acid adenylation domain-containing protein [Streptomyces fragilis]
MTSVVAAFRRRVAQAPATVAVSAGDDRLSYAGLDRWARAVAALLTDAGTGPGDRVAVCLERSPELVAALLGVLDAGAAFVPVGLTDPAGRVAEVLSDAEVRAVLCEPDDADRFAPYGVPVLHVPPRPAGEPDVPAPAVDSPARADGLAYLMYTSGSTGRPKAVMVEHRNIVNLVTDPNYVTLGPSDRVLQLAPVAFDAATFEIWGALLNGARLVLAPAQQVQAEELGTLLRDEGVTVLWLTAALFHRQVEVDVKAFAGLRTVLAGGDVLSVPHIDELRRAVPDCGIVNGYGPTETTTFAVCHRIGADEDLGRAVPIGTPVQNVDVRIVGDDGRPVPDGTPGELWIGGAGVSRGYWRRPDLTERAFVTAPWDPAAGRFYRSGDLARRRPDGVVEFLGRDDDQFKLRGFRIEPGELESTLAAHPQVRCAAVALRDSHLGDRRLVAWLVPEEAGLDRRALRSYLRDRVPEHMIPAAFVAVDALPVTGNGKTDRKALPTPDWTSRSIYI